MHVSAATGVAAIAEARAKQLPVYGETLHQYLAYTAEDYKRPNGQIYHTYPSLKSADDQIALWDGTRRDVIHCVATDELCCTLKDKTARQPHRRHHRRQFRRRAAACHDVYRDGRATAATAWTRFVDLSPPTPPRSWASTRGRARSPSAATPTSLILDPTRRGKITAVSPPRDRLHAVGRPRHLRLAGADHAARQGDGGERRIFRGPRRWPVSQAQNRRRDFERPSALERG